MEEIKEKEQLNIIGKLDRILEQITGISGKASEIRIRFAVITDSDLCIVVSKMSTLAKGR